jgi:hypothetical protein
VSCQKVARVLASDRTTAHHITSQNIALAQQSLAVKAAGYPGNHGTISSLRSTLSEITERAGQTTSSANQTAAVIIELCNRRGC